MAKDKEDQAQQSGDQGGSFTPPNSQAELDALIASATSKFADYAELKAKAEKFDAAEAANLSEVEKATKRAEEAEAKVQAFEAAAQRSTWAQEIVKDSSIPADVLRGNTKEELENHFKQLTALVEAKPGGTAPRITSTPPGKRTGSDKAPSRAVEALRALSLR